MPEKSRGAKHGMDLSVFLGLALLLGLACLLLFPSRGGISEDAKRLCCAESLRKIGVALKAYAAANGGFLPAKPGAEGLEQLRSNGFLGDPKSFFCPGSCPLKELPASPLEKPALCYVYLGAGLKLDALQSPASTPLACDRDGAHASFGEVLFADGSVKGLSGSSWLEKLSGGAKK